MDPPERKRKRLVNYNEGEFYRNAQKAAGAKAPTGPRLAKMPQMQVPPRAARVGPPLVLDKIAVINVILGDMR